VHALSCHIALHLPGVPSGTTVAALFEAVREALSAITCAYCFALLIFAGQTDTMRKVTCMLALVAVLAGASPAKQDQHYRRNLRSIID
jgi:hypothetical protein